MSGFNITSKNELRSYMMGVKGVIFADPSQDLGHLVQSLDPAKSALVEVCYGNLFFQSFKGSHFRGGDWSSLVRIAALIGGTNPDLSGDVPFSKQHYTSVCQEFGGRNPVDGVETVFIHGLYGFSVLLDWYSQGHTSWDQRDDRTATQKSCDDILIGLLRQIFRVTRRGISVWFTVPLRPGINRMSQSDCLVPDIDQPKLLQELTCLSDLIVSQTDVWKDGTTQTVLVTDPRNKWGLPAKSSAAFGLEPLEPPNLSELRRKILTKAMPKVGCLEGFNPLEHDISIS